jgi:UDP-glucose 4-epimerase
MINNSKVLVIGGAGFIGSFVVSELLKTTVGKVIVYDNFARGKKRNISQYLKDPRCEIYPNGGILEILIL